MNEDDYANMILDQLKEEGYKSLEEKQRDRQLQQALRDYDRQLCNPYEY